MKQTFRRITLIVMSLFVALGAYAQVTSSSMSGKITDESGTAVAGATVIAVHTPSGTQYYAVADGSGNYRILNIRPGGPYTVTVEMLGYTKTEIRDISVALADNYVLNTKMKEESLTLQEVVISAESTSSNMRSDRSGAITSIDRNALSSLPSISRSMEDVVKLTPQAYNSGSGPQIGGGNYRQNFFTIDGAAANNAFGIGQSMPASGSPVSMDAIEQMSISVTPYDVRQSGFLGGSLNAVTRSGSNKVEASAYTYYYNEKFRGKFVGSNELTVNEETNLVYGARVGAPIIKNKLFLFLNVEVEKRTEPGPSRVAATGEKPYTTGNDGVARPSATVLDALSTYLKDKWSYDPGLYQGYSSESPSFKALARLDWNINRDHKFNIRYNITRYKYPSNPSTSTSGLADRNYSSTNRLAMEAIPFQNARYFQEQNYSSVAAELNSRFFEGKLNNVLRATYSHQYEPRSTQGGDFPFVDLVVGGKVYTSFGTELFSYGNLRDVTTISVTDELSYSLGRHNLFAGLQYENNFTVNGFQRFGSGFYSFGFADEAALSSAISAGTVFNTPQQFAITHSYNKDFSQSFPSFTFHQFSLYLQDEMSLADNFKLLAGVRFELPMYPDLSNIDNKAVSDAVFASVHNSGGKYNTSQLPSTKVMISPRVGFNWDITGNRQFVLRGGSGLFTGRLPFVWIVAQAGDAGVLQNTYTAKAGGAAVIPTFNADRLNLLQQIYPNGATAANVVPSSVTLMAKDLKMPQTWKSSLALDVKLPADVLFSLEGVYNYDVNPTTITNVGLKGYVSSNIASFPDNRLAWGPRYAAIRDAYLLHNSELSGYYYSVTAKLEKNNWHGFNGMVAYTYSGAESLGDGWGDQMYSAWQNAATVNGQNLRQLGIAGYVMPHRLIASLGYKIEYAKYFGSAISLFFEGGPQGRYSYTYTKNVVGDGGPSNLIYVPKAADELTFRPYTYKDAAGVTQTYTAAQQSADFWAFVEQDPYLKTRKGQYAERNGLVAPWVNQLDLKFTQDFYMTMKNGQRNTLQIGLDIRNFANLLNKNWGSRMAANRTAILAAVNSAGRDYFYQQAGTVAPLYQFQRNGTEVLSTQFAPAMSLGSTWMMQLSVRYIFR